MAEDSEKRFHSVMDKLFHAPKSKASSSSEDPSSRGKKRPKSMLTELKLRGNIGEGFQHSSGTVANTSQAPVCRPWDRGDLMRRLATFKSMTWFAKPKAVSAVNCARRGWVNVDMDIIACEACGARLLFSTPSSWTQHQVEKAAKVFSLKLDSGHKLLCPWIDNICDETLAQFPPLTASLLVDSYKERCSALLQLLALPIISFSAIDCMKSPQLDKFLSQSSMPESGNGSDSLYYQAQKLISLCGWEPRSLPYVVECKSQLNQSSESSNFSDLRNNVQNPVISFYSNSSNDTMEANEDANSVVLDCKLCGASVGLWAFSKVSRPTELLRLVGHAKVNDENDSANFKENRVSLMENVSNLTIAGGPPPTKQNFKATVSFPVIGQNLRARICSNSAFRDLTCVNPDGRDIDDGTSDSVSNNHSENLNDRANEEGNGLKNDQLPGNAEILGTENQQEGDFSSSNANPAATFTNTNGKTSDNDLSMMLSDDDLSQVLGVEFGTEANESTDNSCEMKIGEREKCFDVKNAVDGLKDRVETPANVEKDIKQLKAGKAFNFDPIRQHRHFCPWTASRGSAAPGWQQILSALVREKELSQPSPTNFPSPSIIKVDDPITSIRKLFASPSAKRAKPTRESR